MSQEPANPDYDPEGPEPEEMSDHDEPDLMPCPHCRKMVNEDADRCHHCGRFIDQPPLSSTWSMATILIICLLVVIFAGGLLISLWR